MDNWLVVSTPLKNMKVNWDDYHSQYNGKIIQSCSSHHQPDKFDTICTCSPSWFGLLTVMKKHWLLTLSVSLQQNMRLEMPNPTCSTDKSVNQIQILQAQVPIYATDQAKTETVVKSRKLPPKKRQNNGTRKEAAGICVYRLIRINIHTLYSSWYNHTTK